MQCIGCRAIEDTDSVASLQICAPNDKIPENKKNGIMKGTGRRGSYARGGAVIRSAQARYSFAYLGISYAPGGAEGGLRI
jgi:hypothetical protein